MAIGINDYDDFDEYDDTITQDINDDFSEEDQFSEFHEDDSNDIDPVIQELLRSKGINDSSKIKFENEDGDIEEHDWNSLTEEDKLGILQSGEDYDEYEPEEGLDNDEIQLINSIRSSKMTPSEYLNYVQRNGVNNYIQNQNINQFNYQVDDIDDNTLYVLDTLARVGENALTDAELEEMLVNAQSNPESFQKQINAIRNEYRQREDDNRRQIEYQQQQQQVSQFNQFAESIENEIRNFKDLGGYELNMSEDEMEEVYDFITGFDAAGVSVFGKALNNPETLVKMAWWALNGEQAIQDINDYWTNEIKNISKAKKGNKVQIATKPKNTKKSDSFDDFDDEF